MLDRNAAPEDRPRLVSMHAVRLPRIPSVDRIIRPRAPEQGRMRGADRAPDFLGPSFTPGFGADGEFGQVVTRRMPFEHTAITDPEAAAVVKHLGEAEFVAFSVLAALEDAECRAEQVGLAQLAGV